MQKLADEFEAAVGEIVQTVSFASTESNRLKLEVGRFLDTVRAA